MKPEVQATLASALQYAREMKAQRVANLRIYLAHAEGVVAGLEDTGALTGKEAGEWKKKVWVLADEPAKRSGRVRRPTSRLPKPITGFIRLIPGPHDPEPLLDGFMRIVATELFQDRVRIHWHLSPLPSHEAVLSDDLKELDGDTEGLDEDSREDQRFSARLIRLHRLLRFSASDDLGTKYRCFRGGSGGSVDRGELGGVADFLPGLPTDASSLVIGVHDAKFTIPLR